MTHEMEGKPLSPNRFDLLNKIRELTRSIIEDLCHGRSPTLQIDQFSSYCTDASENWSDVFSLSFYYYYYWLIAVVDDDVVAAMICQKGRRFSCCLKKVKCVDQSVVDRAINDICILLQCCRHNLNVVSVGNGLVMGWLRFAESGRIFDCINSPNVAHHIPVQVEDVADIISVSEYILVVEKESVFQRLANDQFCKQNRCIVVTGRGYPDVPTRRFLHLLIEKLRLPVYCLVDCDPYGIDILTTYRFGSMQMSYDSKSLRLPEMHWLGAFPSDCQKYQLPQQCLLPLTAEDKKKAEGILRRCYMEREVPYWRSELQLMLDGGVKFEIEALSAQSITFLSENYLPSKIRGGEYI
ncbi:meiotic recombination protein spo11-1 [Phtheirospermum japonicum]|uniref:DNA topoisomerase (ATP-hydrolyzing) n=1 Tax=Phtheirospermum japonicum TaxID=374723 RepID=A0A830B0C9_9LAMI|nr:meiotic recombination protein spo11-1 [Phtheirospermum japonicum]